MKIIKQLNERDFVVRMEEHDKRETFEVIPTKFSIAHDYVQFDTMMSIYTYHKEIEKISDSPFKVCENVISYKASVQIGIRKFFKVVLPLLLKNKYLQEDHFAKKN